MSGRRDLRRVEPCSHAYELEGKRVLVSAGGTREPIDAVRFSHRFLGLDGVALRRRRLRGAEVTCRGESSGAAPGKSSLVTAPTAGSSSVRCREFRTPTSS